MGRGRVVDAYFTDEIEPILRRSLADPDPAARSRRSSATSPGRSCTTGAS